MILRVVRGHIMPGRSQEFHARVAAALSAIGQMPGLIHVDVGIQRCEDGEHVAFSSTWRDLESIYRWVGSNNLLYVSAGSCGYEDVLDECDVQHYEVLGPAEPAADDVPQLMPGL